jgi:hypothetical protein
VFLALRARLIGVAVRALPASIVKRLVGTTKVRVGSMLRWLSPLTTSSVPNGSRFVGGLG